MFVVAGAAFLAVKLLVVTVLAFYGLVSLIVFEFIRRRLSRKVRPKFSKVGKRARCVVIILALGGVGCAAWGYFVEPYWLEVTHNRIVSARLPEGAGPIRIVHISDLHCDAKVRLEEKLVDVVAGLKPDLIVFTGDAINSLDGMEVFRKCMKGLAETAPTFAVRGNWENHHDPEAMSKLYEGTGVRELDGSVAKLTIGGADIYIAGVSAHNPSAIETTLAKIPDGAPAVFLHHFPGQILRVADLNKADLYCAGHTHGGQIALPFYGAIITLARFGKRFEAGLYQVEDTWLYVSRGLGMEGGRAPRMRFCARPEVALIELAPRGGGHD